MRVTTPTPRVQLPDKRRYVHLPLPPPTRRAVTWCARRALWVLHRVSRRLALRHTHTPCVPASQPASQPARPALAKRSSNVGVRAACTHYTPWLCQRVLCSLTGAVRGISLALVLSSVHLMDWMRTLTRRAMAHR